MRNLDQVHPKHGQTPTDSQARNPHTDPVTPGEPRTPSVFSDENVSKIFGLITELYEHVAKQRFVTKGVVDRLNCWITDEEPDEQHLNTFAHGFMLVSDELNDSLDGLQNDIFKMFHAFALENERLRWPCCENSSVKFDRSTTFKKIMSECGLA